MAPSTSAKTSQAELSSAYVCVGEDVSPLRLMAPAPGRHMNDTDFAATPICPKAWPGERKFPSSRSFNDNESLNAQSGQASLECDHTLDSYELCTHAPQTGPKFPVRSDLSGNGEHKLEQSGGRVEGECLGGVGMMHSRSHCECAPLGCTLERECESTLRGGERCTKQAAAQQCATGRVYGLEMVRSAGSWRASALQVSGGGSGSVHVSAAPGGTCRHEHGSDRVHTGVHDGRRSAPAASGGHDGHATVCRTPAGPSEPEVATAAENRADASAGAVARGAQDAGGYRGDGASWVSTCSRMATSAGEPPAATKRTISLSSLAAAESKERQHQLISLFIRQWCALPLALCWLLPAELCEALVWKRFNLPCQRASVLLHETPLHHPITALARNWQGWRCSDPLCWCGVQLHGAPSHT